MHEKYYRIEKSLFESYVADFNTAIKTIENRDKKIAELKEQIKVQRKEIERLRNRLISLEAEREIFCGKVIDPYKFDTTA
jgi:predicted RNase H-like nuclease (RuvC/YqgF family)